MSLNNNLKPAKINSIQTPVIGLFVNNLYHYYEAEIYEGIYKACNENNIDFITFVGGSFNNPQIDNKGKNYIYNLASKISIDGLIIFSSSIGSYISNKKFKSFLEKYYHLPLLSVGMFFDKISSITINNENAIIKQIEHLIKIHKYKKIAFIKGPQNNIEAAIRYNTYKKCLINNNMPFDKNLVFQGSFHAICGKEIVDNIIKNNKMGIDAIIGSNDYVSLKIIEELNKHNIKVPGDIAVVGFDDIIESKYDKYSLTTITQPTFELGYNSVKMMLSMLENKKQIFNKKLECELIIRKSCGCLQNNHNDKNKIDNSPIITKKNDFLKTSKNFYNKIEFIQFKKRLMNVTNFKDFEDVILLGLSIMDVNRCFIGLFNSSNTNKSKLILAFNYNKKNYKQKNFLFSSEELIPGGIKKLKNKKNIFIYSLNYFEENIGYIIYEINLNINEISSDIINIYGEIFESLSLEISNTINNIIIYNNIKKTFSKNIDEKLEKKFIKDYARKCCLPEKTGKEYYIKLMDLMKTKKPYINPDLTLVKLAEMVCVSRTHLSFIINVYANQKFYDFINYYRIEEAKKNLSEKINEKLSILDIAYLSGFNSKSSFNRAFKRFTKLTPKEYKKINKNKNHKNQ